MSEGSDFGYIEEICKERGCTTLLPAFRELERLISDELERRFSVRSLSVGYRIRCLELAVNAGKACGLSPIGILPLADQYLAWAHGEPTGAGGDLRSAEGRGMSEIVTKGGVAIRCYAVTDGARIAAADMPGPFMRLEISDNGGRTINADLIDNDLPDLTTAMSLVFCDMIKETQVGS